MWQNFRHLKWREWDWPCVGDENGGSYSVGGVPGSPDVCPKQIWRKANVERVATMRRQPKKFGGQKREGQESRRNGPSGLFTTHAAHPGSASLLPSEPLPSQQVRLLQVWLQPFRMYIPLPLLTSSCFPGSTEAAEHTLLPEFSLAQVSRSPRPTVLVLPL